jgi:hypothetical protein
MLAPLASSEGGHVSGVVASVPVNQQLERRGRIVALAIVGLAAALLVALVLPDSGDDTPTAGSGQPAAVTPPPPSGIRYDGRPEEGAVGTVVPPVDVNPSTGYATPRYDGGPEEGSRGPSATARR